MIHIFSQPEIRKYKASVTSKAFLFYCICLLTAFAAPLFIAYKTHGLWILESTFREQPSVYYKYQAILLLQTNVRQVLWSTFPNINSLPHENFLFPVVKVREVDSNMDGKSDWLELTMQVSLSDTEHVHSTMLLLVFDYWLVTYSAFVMEGLAVISHASSLQGSVLHASGDLNFKQTQPLEYKGTDTSYTAPIIDSLSWQQSERNVAKILSDYRRRNVSTEFENALYLWEHGRPAGQPFRINATIWYTTPVVAYRPGFWFALKWAWVQYVAIMLAVYFAMDKVKQFVLDNRIVSCFVQQPILDCRLRS